MARIPASVRIKAALLPLLGVAVEPLDARCVLQNCADSGMSVGVMTDCCATTLNERETERGTQRFTAPCAPLQQGCIKAAWRVKNYGSAT